MPVIGRRALGAKANGREQPAADDREPAGGACPSARRHGADANSTRSGHDAGGARALPRRTILAALAALCVAPAAHAQDSAAIQAPIKALYAALDAQMHGTTGANFRARFDTLTPVIEKVFDLDTILSVSVGLRWSGFDAATKASLSRAFRRFTVATYVAHFDKYDGEKFDILPQLRSSGADQIVATRIVPAKGDPTRLDYVMRQAPAGWQIVDVLLDGTISRVAVQRSDFRALLSQGGAPALVRSLESKVADLSGGALES